MPPRVRAPRAAAPPPYPEWSHFPRYQLAPEWLDLVLHVGQQVQPSISTPLGNTLGSDDVLAHLRPGLQFFNFDVERGKRDVDKVKRPALLGDRGVTAYPIEVDAVHDGFGIVVEVEAGRAMAGGHNVHRDLIRSSLMVSAEYLLLLVPIYYVSNKEASYEKARSLLDAIYADGGYSSHFRASH